MKILSIRAFSVRDSLRNIGGWGGRSFFLCGQSRARFDERRSYSSATHWRRLRSSWVHDSPWRKASIAQRMARKACAKLSCITFPPMTNAAYGSNKAMARMIVLKDYGKRVYLLTNVMETTRLSRRMAGEFYRARWGIEVEYRGLKQTLGHRKVLTRTPEPGALELAADNCPWIDQPITTQHRRMSLGDQRVRGSIPFFASPWSSRRA